jgi:hypothetical protein
VGLPTPGFVSGKRRRKPPLLKMDADLELSLD